MGRIDDVLRERRAHLVRLTPHEARKAHGEGALLIDTRTEWQRQAQGELPGAIVVDRTVLEWRLDATSEVRIPEAVPGVRIVVMCRQGYSSSLAAAGLRDLGLDATDVIGGVEAWLQDGLPTHLGPADERR